MFPLQVLFLKSNFSGKAIDFQHNYIIRIDISSQPWALLALRFFIIKRRSFSLTSNDFSRLLVLKLKLVSCLYFELGCIVPQSSIRVCCYQGEAMYLVSFLFENLFIIDQNVFDVMPGQSNFELILAV